MRKILLFTFALSLLITGCQTSGAAKKLDIELSDFKITPNQFTAQAGTEVTVSVTNNGTVKHDLTIMKLGVDIGTMFDDEDRPNILWETEVQPGETKSATFTAPDKMGSYEVICAMPGHMQAGMVGAFEVVK